MKVFDNNIFRLIIKQYEDILRRDKIIIIIDYIKRRIQGKLNKIIEAYSPHQVKGYKKTQPRCEDLKQMVADLNLNKLMNETVVSPDGSCQCQEIFNINEYIEITTSMICGQKYYGGVTENLVDNSFKNIKKLLLRLSINTLNRMTNSELDNFC
jgi:hypothetical protein